MIIVNIYNKNALLIDTINNITDPGAILSVDIDWEKIGGFMDGSIKISPNYLYNLGTGEEIEVIWSEDGQPQQMVVGYIRKIPEFKNNDVVQISFSGFWRRLGTKAGTETYQAQVNDDPIEFETRQGYQNKTVEYILHDLIERNIRPSIPVIDNVIQANYAAGEIKVVVSGSTIADTAVLSYLDGNTSTLPIGETLVVNESYILTASAGDTVYTRASSNAIIDNLSWVTTKISPPVLTLSNFLTEDMKLNEILEALVDVCNFDYANEQYVAYINNDKELVFEKLELIDYLHEGLDFYSPDVSEEEPKINSVTLYTKNKEDSNATVFRGTIRDAISVERYGLKNEPLVFTLEEGEDSELDITDEDTIIYMAKMYLSRYAYPQTQININRIQREPKVPVITENLAGEWSPTESYNITDYGSSSAGGLNAPGPNGYDGSSISIPFYHSTDTFLFLEIYGNEWLSNADRTSWNNLGSIPTTDGAKIILVNGDWDVFDNIGNGMIGIDFESGGGTFEFYYHKDAFMYAFFGTSQDIRIAVNRSVYKGSIAPENLVVRWDGARGVAGGGTAQDIRYTPPWKFESDIIRNMGGSTIPIRQTITIEKNSNYVMQNKGDIVVEALLKEYFEHTFVKASGTWVLDPFGDLIGLPKIGENSAFIDTSQPVKIVGSIDGVLEKGVDYSGGFEDFVSVNSGGNVTTNLQDLTITYLYSDAKRYRDSFNSNNNTQAIIEAFSEIDTQTFISDFSIRKVLPLEILNPILPHGMYSITTQPTLYKKTIMDAVTFSAKATGAGPGDWDTSQFTNSSAEISNQNFLFGSRSIKLISTFLSEDDKITYNFNTIVYGVITFTVWVYLEDGVEVDITLNGPYDFVSRTVTAQGSWLKVQLTPVRNTESVGLLTAKGFEVIENFQVEQILGTPENFEVISAEERDNTSYSVGDVGPSGGIIFDTPNENNDFTYSEVTPLSEQKMFTTWGESVSYFDSLSFGGNSDWSLPTLDQLFKIYSSLYLNDIGGFSDSRYWSIEEYNGSIAYYFDFWTGTPNTESKAPDFVFPLSRGVRTFKVLNDPENFEVSSSEDTSEKYLLTDEDKYLEVYATEPGAFMCAVDSFSVKFNNDAVGNCYIDRAEIQAVTNLNKTESIEKQRLEIGNNIRNRASFGERPSSLVDEVKKGAEEGKTAYDMYKGVTKQFGTP